ncbi:hypothetical protein PIB30_085784 [Stylosanthes scabra]|uniref:Uncharacterized protein n=1 Tax=Stylosanthes scabra TaxID=79078 RepID=A0ABU6VTX6_9FABA|nr:hypothetical protein [Stylosanthes scabra]
MGSGLSKHEVNWEGSNNSSLDSTATCLFSPGFEPTGDPSLISGAKTRVANFPQIESGEQNSVRGAILLHDRNLVDVCEEAVPIVVVLLAESKKQLGVNQGSDKEESDESLYQINKEANGWLLVRHDAYTEHVLEDDGSIAEPGALLENDKLNSAEHSPSGVEGVVAAESSNGSSVFGGQHLDNVDAKDVESEDEDGRVEALETKKVFDKGGISFYSSDKEEVLTRLAERIIVGKGRIDLRPRKQKQGRKVPCLEAEPLLQEH